MTINLSRYDSNYSAFTLIPDGTPVCMVMRINRSQYGELVTESASGAKYLKSEFIVCGGQHSNRKISQLVGIHSPKGPKWSEMGGAFLKTLYLSAKGVNEEEPVIINDYDELERKPFACIIGISKEKDREGNVREYNIINKILLPMDSEYGEVMKVANKPVAQTTGFNDDIPF